jgi:hypothetical protein
MSSSSPESPGLPPPELFAIDVLKQLGDGGDGPVETSAPGDELNCGGHSRGAGPGSWSATEARRMPTESTPVAGVLLLGTVCDMGAAAAVGRGLVAGPMWESC